MTKFQIEEYLRDMFWAEAVDCEEGAIISLINFINDTYNFESQNSKESPLKSLLDRKMEWHLKLAGYFKRIGHLSGKQIEILLNIKTSIYYLSSLGMSCPGNKLLRPMQS